MTNGRTNRVVNTALKNVEPFIGQGDRFGSRGGYSLIELLIVVAMIGVLSAMALPQLVAQRRLYRSVAMTREILSQMRHARQQAMAQRQAFTFQYNNTTKQTSIIDHNLNTGVLMLADASYPNNAEARVLTATPLAVGGLVQSEIIYGIPATLPNGALRDGSQLAALNSSILNITFQPDGSVINAAGNPVDLALFIYNSRSPRETASAISVVGASGRTKIWRYDINANVYSD